MIPKPAKKKKKLPEGNRLIVFKTSTCSFNSPVTIVCMCVGFFFFKLSLIDLFFLSAMAEDRAIDATSTVEKVFKLLQTKMNGLPLLLSLI